MSRPWRFPLSLAFLGLAFVAVGQAATVHDLRCDYQHDPVSLDDLQPQLGWTADSTARGDRQTAYRILVASTPAKLAADTGDLWDSGRVASDQSGYIAYAGATLASRERCWWKVKIWDQSGHPSDWSAPARWTMGLLRPGDWTAKWITPSRWFIPPEDRPAGLILGKTGGWADVDLGSAVPIEAIRLFPEKAENFPLRFRVLLSDDFRFAHAQTVVDQIGADYALRGTGAQEFPLAGTAAPHRYVRLEIMGGRGDQGTTVRQLEVISRGQNVALMKFTREYGTDYSKGHGPYLVDGMPSQNEGAECPPDACPMGAAPLLRKAFALRGPVKRATLYHAALGMAEITVNGKKVGDEVLGLSFSDYSKRVYYWTHDITAQLAAGSNVLGITLANGFFTPPKRGYSERNGGDGPPRVLVQAEIEYMDGTRETIRSDETWKWSTGEITFNDLWAGYTEDRRLAQAHWSEPGFDDSRWRAAGRADAPTGALRADPVVPVRVLDEVLPSRIDGSHVTFAVESSGWLKVKVNGHAGQTITVTGQGSGFEMPKLSFTLAANGPAVLEPKFIYSSGPTELQFAGLTEPLAQDAVSFLHANADLAPAGEFACSNPYLNWLYAILQRTHRNFIFHVAMDPSREKQGWTQDASNMFLTASYLSDMRALYPRWWHDLADNQDEQGFLGTVEPVVNRQVYDWNSPWWSGTLIFLPWEHYRQYGDRRFLEQAYQPMRRYLDFLGQMVAAGYDTDGAGGRGQGIWDEYPYLTQHLNPAVARERMLYWNGAGDWQNPDFPGSQHAVPTPMTTMPAWYHFALIVSRTASLLGKTDEARQYAALAEDVKTRFNAKYFHPETGYYGDEKNNETAQILPIAVGMVPEGKEQLAYQRLIDPIHARTITLEQDSSGCPG